MSFSAIRSKGSRPVGMIKWPATKFNNQMVFVNPDAPESKEGKEEKQVVNKDPITGDERIPMSMRTDFWRLGRQGDKVKNTDMALIQQILAGDEAEDEADWSQFQDREAWVKSRLKEAKEEIKSRRRDFDLERDGWVEPLCDDSAREAVFVVGCAGAGKSVFAGKKMRSYAKQNPSNPIYLLSKVESDHAFDDIPNVTRVAMDEKFISDVNTGKIALKDCMIVFDDVDTIADEKTRKAVQKLRADLLETGRHGDVYVISTSHVFRGGKQTHAALNESTSVVCYPKSGEVYHIRDFLKVYGGLDKSQIDRVMSLGSRWVELHRKMPRFVLHERGGYFL